MSTVYGIMIGTEKQIKWAEDIKEEANRVMKNYISMLSEQGNNSSKFEKQLETFNKIEDAAFLIKYRSWIPDFRNMPDELQKLMNPSLYDIIEAAEDFDII